MEDIQIGITELLNHKYIEKLIKRRITEGCSRVRKTHGNCSRSFLISRRMVPANQLDENAAAPLPGGHHDTDSLSDALYLPAGSVESIASLPGFPSPRSNGYWTENDLDHWFMRVQPTYILKFLWRWWLVEREACTWRAQYGYVHHSNDMSPMGMPERIRVAS